MTKSQINLFAPGHPRRGIRAFTILEVLFSLIIFGIGLITLAAIFPVAMRQTQTNVDASEGSAEASAAVKIMAAIFAPMGSSVPQSASIPGNSGVVYSFNDARCPATSALWQAICGNVICTANPRYGWIGFYRRGVDANGVALPYIQTYVIAVSARSEAIYVAPGTSSTGSSDVTNGMLQPLLCDVSINETVSPPEITFNDVASGSGTGSLNPLNSPVGENAYVLISDDENGGALNGTFLQVGNPSPSGTANCWQLQPGWDLSGTLSGSGNSMKAFIVGRQIDPATLSGTPLYSGPVQDLLTASGTAVFTTLPSTATGGSSGSGSSH